MRAISQDFQALVNVAVAVLDSEGRLLEANACFMRILGKGPGRHIGADVSARFRMPGYKFLAAAQPLDSGEVFQGTMRFLDGSGEGIELRGKVTRSAFGLCLQAEAGAGEPAHQPRASELEARRNPDVELRKVDPDSTDALTGTGTRAWLDQSLAIEMARMQHSGGSLSMLIVGLDRFAELTGKFGAAAGDKVLARFGFLLRLLTRPTDIAARIGAEEFAVLLPNTNIAQAMAAAERIKKAIATDVTPPLSEPANASFGYTEFRSGEGAASFLGRARASLGPARGLA